MTTPLDIPSKYLVRDLFLFSAFTGISFSDIRNLKYSDLTTNDDGTVWIHSKRMKTGVEFHVPLLALPIKLIDKYQGVTEGEHLFRMLSNVKTNPHLKNIAQMCGIDKCLYFHAARHCGSLFDMPILPNGDDPEEEMFRRRMQKKKKRGRRM